jgi:acyl carrier protein
MFGSRAVVRALRPMENSVVPTQGECIVSNTGTQLDSTVQAIKELVLQHARLPVESIAEGDDLYAAGLTSLATVGLLLAIEERFEIEFPESMLSRATFRSVESIAESVSQLVR